MCFREENRFMIYLVNFSGLYLTSIEKFIKNKLILYFLAVYSKLPMILTPIYLGSGMTFLLFDEGSLSVKIPVLRRQIAFFCGWVKIVFLYCHRKEMEALMDLWDSCFEEEFYPENRAEKLRRNHRQNAMFLITTWLLTLTGGLVYTVPPFFSKVKKLNHPSGIPYREQSPDYELMAVFDFFRVVAGALSSMGVDIIVMVFFSLATVQVAHLKDCLTDMVNAISIDDEGRVTFRSGGAEEPGSGDGGLHPGSSGYIESVNEFDSKIRIWIRHHQQAIRYYERLRQLFTPIVSIQVVYITFYTCFTAFHLVHARSGIDVFVLPFVASGNLVSLFVFCYLGDQAENTSYGLFEDAFSRAWFLFPKKVKTCFSFIVMRSRKPLILRGMSLIRINLASFFQLMKVAYQLFAFLLKVSTE